MWIVSADLPKVFSQQFLPLCCARYPYENSHCEYIAEWWFSTTPGRVPFQSPLRQLIAKFLIDRGARPVIRCRNKVAAQPWSPTELKGRATEVKYEVQAAVRLSCSFPFCFHSERQRTRCCRPCRHSSAVHAE